MNQTEIAHLLEDKLASLVKRQQQVLHNQTQSHSRNSREQSQEREEDEIFDALGDQADRSIQQIRRALEQVKLGQYGVCTVCGSEIQKVRLDALPESTECIHCA